MGQLTRIYWLSAGLGPAPFVARERVLTLITRASKSTSQERETLACDRRRLVRRHRRQSRPAQQAMRA
jgi:hypothetical protein